MRSLLLLLVIGKLIEAEVKAADQRHRQKLLADSGLGVGDRVGVRVPGPDGAQVRVGTVRVDPGARVVLFDERKLVAFVREHAPTELTEAVRPKFREELTRQIKEHGGWVNPATGEVVPVPGAVVEERGPRVYVAPEEGAAELIRQAHARGALPELGGFMEAIRPGGGVD